MARPLLIFRKYRQRRTYLISKVAADRQRSSLGGGPPGHFADTHIQLVGPLFWQRFFTRQPITDQLIDSIVARYLTNRPEKK
ncbi:MAG: hypothetical protein V3V01_17290 [Acidimicrobiales bacterium]